MYQQSQLINEAYRPVIILFCIDPLIRLVYMQF